MDFNHYTPIYQIDRLTFCTYFFAACLFKQQVTPEMRSLFVRDCARRFPTIVDEFVTLDDGLKYGWEFNGDYKITEEHKIPASRNFMVWKRNGTEVSRFAGQNVLRKVTSDLSNDKCNFFGGPPGMGVRIEDPVPVDAAASSGLLREIQKKITFGATLILGGLLFWITKGRLPPVPESPSFSPSLNPSTLRNSGA